MGPANTDTDIISKSISLQIPIYFDKNIIISLADIWLITFIANIFQYFPKIPVFSQNLVRYRYPISGYQYWYDQYPYQVYRYRYISIDQIYHIGPTLVILLTNLAILTLQFWQNSIWFMNDSLNFKIIYPQFN